MLKNTSSRCSQCFYWRCQAPSNTLSIEPVMKLPSADPTLGAATISITGVDKRSSQTLAEFSRNGQLAQLRPSRDLRFLMQETPKTDDRTRFYDWVTGKRQCADRHQYL